MKAGLRLLVRIWCHRLRIVLLAMLIASVSLAGPMSAIAWRSRFAWRGGLSVEALAALATLGRVSDQSLDVAVRVAVGCGVGLIVVTFIDWLLLEHSFILLFRKFNNPRSRMLIYEVVDPIARASAYWVSLADRDLSERNTGYDVAPAFVALLSSGPLWFLLPVAATMLGMPVAVGVSAAVIVSIAATALTFMYFRKRRRMVVEKSEDISAVADRLSREVGLRVPSIWMPYFAVVRVVDELWQSSVRALIPRCDAIVMVIDEAAETDSLEWEQKQAAAARIPTVIMWISLEGTVVLETRRPGCPPVREEPLHLSDTPGLIRVLRTAIAQDLYKDRRSVSRGDDSAARLVLAALGYYGASLIVPIFAPILMMIGFFFAREGWRRGTWQRPVAKSAAFVVYGAGAAGAVGMAGWVLFLFLSH